MQLPYLQSDNQILNQLQMKWRAILNPALEVSIINGIQLSLSLVRGPNTINHKLQRTMQGFIITDLTGPAVIWRTQPMNQTTLSVICSSTVNVTAGMWVY